MTDVLGRARLAAGRAGDRGADHRAGRSRSPRSRPTRTPTPTTSGSPGSSCPGFANTHSHAFHRALRGRTHGGGGTFWTWREQMYAVAARLDPDTYFALARATLRRDGAGRRSPSSASSTTCTTARADGPYADPNAMGDALIAAAARGRHPAHPARHLLPRRRSDRRRAHRRSTPSSSGSATAPSTRGPTGVAAHPAARRPPPGSVPPSTRSAPCREAVARRGRRLRPRAGRCTSTSPSSPPRTIACEAFYGCTPTELLRRHRRARPDTTAVHATHLTAADIALLGGSGTACCFCPTTERDLADGIGPARDLADAGVARSASAATSTPSIDPLRGVRGLEMHERLDHAAARPVHARPSWSRAATAHGHRSLGWPGGGRIAAGRAGRPRRRPARHGPHRRVPTRPDRLHGDRRRRRDGRRRRRRSSSTDGEHQRLGVGRAAAPRRDRRAAGRTVTADGSDPRHRHRRARHAATGASGRRGASGPCTTPPWSSARTTGSPGSAAPRTHGAGRRPADRPRRPRRHPRLRRLPHATSSSPATASAEFDARMTGAPYDGGGIASTVAATRAASDDELRRLLGGPGRRDARPGHHDRRDQERLRADRRPTRRGALRLAGEVTAETTFLGAPRRPAGVPGPPRRLRRPGHRPDAHARRAPHARWVDVFCEPAQPARLRRGRGPRRCSRPAAPPGWGCGCTATSSAPGPGVQLAVELGAASVDHCTYLTDADVDALAGGDDRRDPAARRRVLHPLALPRRARACSTPASGSRWPPTATRAPASPSSMPFVIALAVREMRLTPQEALWAATRGAADSLGRDDIGRIAVGARGGVTVLDAPSHRHLAYRAGVPLARRLSTAP